ncbi:MAG: HAMP domain-containing histidine kinase [Fuerstiella sp.]|nr:HAMP domain-containing histidine kinase [Fuerstiella sp.]
MRHDAEELNLIRQDRIESTDWVKKILRCLTVPSATEDAVSAAAAIWLLTEDADTAVAITFTSGSEYLVANASRSSDGDINVSMTAGQRSITALFAVDQLTEIASPHGSSHDLRSFVWPDRFSACLVNRPKTSDTTTADAAATVLANARSQHTVIPDPDRMESMAEFAAGAGHEINNPLGSIIGQTQLLLNQEPLTARRQSLGTIGSQAWRIRDMIGDCMLFARPPAPDPERCEMVDLVRQATSDAVNSFEAPSSQVRFDLPTPPVTIDIDSSQIRTLVSHLARNAMEACLDGGVRADILVSLIIDASAVILTVSDQGPGITDEKLRRHLFDPFFSGRQAGRGIGFGLPVCWQIARNHGGLILQESPPDGGAKFVVVLPRVG